MSLSKPYILFPTCPLLTYTIKKNAAKKMPLYSSFTKLYDNVTSRVGHLSRGVNSKSTPTGWTVHTVFCPFTRSDM